MGRKDVLFMENGELRELMEGFEAVWQRVSPAADEAPAAQEPAAREAQTRPEPCSGRVPRWFCGIETK